MMFKYLDQSMSMERNRRDVLSELGEEEEKRERS